MAQNKIIPVRLEEEMKKSYLAYAMSVIVGRALPDVRDGLKPVHRRILYAMYEDGITPDKPFKKSATVVGNVMARYHPHGDAAIYDSLVRLAQNFNTRYLLVDGHGNFGSVDGDPPAAMRYTEARLSPIALEMLRDIQKETVDTVPNFDDTLKEPAVLPARFPNLLVNGSAGIAVGMATNIPPHNLKEVIEGAILLLDQPQYSIEDLMKFIKGPDFPTGGIILGRDGIKKAYQTGKGIIKVRAKTEIEQMENGKSRIVVTEIPYQVNKARLVEKIAELVREKKIEGITDLRDESDRTGMRIVMELKREAKPEILLNQLYKHTQMQDTFGIIQLALVHGQPKVLNLKQILEHYLDHQKDVVTRRTKFDLAKARARAHVLEGLRIAISHLDEVIKTIRQSKDDNTAKEALMTKFELSDIQAQAILDMRLRRLTGLERDKLEAEYEQLLKNIAYYEEILVNPDLMAKIIKEELQAIKEKYTDPRRTKIVAREEKLELEDLISEEEVVVAMTHRGYIKRMPVSTYRIQKRGGRGVSALATREEDFVRHFFITSTHDYLLFFSNKGKVYRLKVYEVPEMGKQGRGTALINLIYLDNDEYITAVIPVKEFSDDHYLLMATTRGIIKKTVLSEYDTSRRDGIIALSLKEGDRLIAVTLTEGRQEVVLGTKLGQAIRFHENEVRPMGRTAAGVKAISLTKDDRVVAMNLVVPQTYLLTVTKNGFGKLTEIEEYRTQSRGGKGLIAYHRTERNGDLVGLLTVTPDDQIMAITSEGILIRLNVNEISRMGRNTQGVKVMRLDSGSSLVAVAKTND